MSPTLELCVCIFGGPGCLGLTSMLPVANAGWWSVIEIQSAL